jgi:hypothetical protein
MASCDLLLLQSVCCAGQTVRYPPNAAEADEGSPRVRRSASLMDLVECRASLDEVSVAGEGYDDGWGWWGLQSLLRWGVLVLARTLWTSGGPQLTRRKVECGVHRAVDDARLEAGVCIPKSDRGVHDGSSIKRMHRCWFLQ